MRERDKGWKTSKKLQAAIAAAVIIVLVYLDNRHSVTLADHILSICELVIVAALSGRVGMGVTESIMGGATSAAENVVQRIDPKDIDGLPQ